jgi:hypothetical protein
MKVVVVTIVGEVGDVVGDEVGDEVVVLVDATVVFVFLVFFVEDVVSCVIVTCVVVVGGGRKVTIVVRGKYVVGKLAVEV